MKHSIIKIKRKEIYTMEKEKEKTFIIKIGSSMHLMKSIKEIKLPDECSHSSRYMKDTKFFTLGRESEIEQFKKLVEWDVQRALSCFDLVKRSKELYEKGYMIIPLYSVKSIEKIKQKGFTVERCGWAVDYDDEDLYKVSWNKEEQV